MSARLFNRPVWAGMVMRMEDGTTYAVELTHDIEGEIAIDYEQAESAREWWVQYVPTGRARASIKLDGWAGQVVRRRPGEPAPDMPTPPDAITAAPREIEA
jgi:hypothetical protein